MLGVRGLFVGWNEGLSFAFGWKQRWAPQELEVQGITKISATRTRGNPGHALSHLGEERGFKPNARRPLRGRETPEDRQITAGLWEEQECSRLGLQPDAQPCKSPEGQAEAGRTA